MKALPFIINWPGQYERVCNVESNMERILGEKPIVINGDENITKDNWIDVDKATRFGDHFLMIFEMFDSLKNDKDVMLLITGDATSNNWDKVIKSAAHCFDTYNCGVYTPFIEHSPWNRFYLDIDFPEWNIKALANSDEIVTFIHRDICNMFINQYRGKFKDNVYGWGIDIICCALSWLNKRPVLQDRSVLVSHPFGSSYNRNNAIEQMNKTFSNIEDKKVKDVSNYIYNINLDKLREAIQ